MWLYEKSKIECEIPANIHDVFKFLADKSNVAWRKNIVRVQTEASSKNIIEIYLNGQQLTYNLLDENPSKYRIYKIQHRFFSGYIMEEFKFLSKESTRIIITEKIRMHNDFLGIYSKLALNFKLGQENYVNDLKTHLIK